MAKTYLLTSQIHLDAPLDRVFSFFSEAENLELLTPRFLGFEIVTPTPVPMREGARIEYRLSVHGIPMRWESEIPVWDPPRRFVDRQVRGPYRVWEHDHRFEAVDGGTLCTDSVRFEVPFGTVVVPLFVRRDLERIFRFRHRTLHEIFSPERARGPTTEAELQIEPLPTAA